MDREEELHELKDLRQSLRWFKYDHLNLKKLGSLRSEVNRRIQVLERRKLHERRRKIP